MKRLALVLGILLIGGNLGCKKDPCKNTQCQNGGTCTDGTCKCNLPWEGTKCEVDARDKFVGAWRGPASCSNDQVSLTIIKSTVSPIRLVIEDIYAELTSSTNITIPSQQITSQGVSVTVSGNGVLNGNTLILTITTSFGQEGGSCTYTLTRQ